MPKPGAGGRLAPQYLADQFTPFQSGEGRLSSPINTGTPNFFHLPASLISQPILMIIIAKTRIECLFPYMYTFLDFLSVGHTRVLIELKLKDASYRGFQIDDSVFHSSINFVNLKSQFYYHVVLRTLLLMLTWLSRQAYENITYFHQTDPLV